MYTQESKSGIKHFLVVVGMAIVAVVLSDILSVMVDNIVAGRLGEGFNAMLVQQILLAAMCVYMIFMVYNHYASHFTYTITPEHIVIVKRTGRRESEYEIQLRDILKIYLNKNPKIKGRKLRLCKSMFSYKNTAVIVCEKENRTVIFEPDLKFIGKLKEYMND